MQAIEMHYFSNLFDEVKAKLTPKQAYVALRDPGG
jgi:hypothetical protein